MYEKVNKINSTSIYKIMVMVEALIVVQRSPKVYGSNPTIGFSLGNHLIEGIHWRRLSCQTF